jgi:DNA-binding transcriptional regulator WhiA
MTLEEQNEMMTNLKAMSEMLTLLDRMTALDDVLMAEPIQHTRWAMSKLAKRNWRLSY